MFRKEKHTRESYENAKENKDIADKEVADARRDGISPEDSRTQKHDKWLTRSEKRRIKAREKLDDLMASGHKEALKLNKEYDRLLENFDRALSGIFPTSEKEENQKNPEEAANRAADQLEDFETKKLGMNKWVKEADEQSDLKA